ncbi:GNAT family N-acetyltransferase [Cohaesibacter gelatinilyticus]|uniref:Acetyltransferase (GNAT) domain-containing protein n=1 Tax=Cohaesibacter gelatinilyticus TaxID=372072 RepID=A0A285PFK3_9HYPH|nr:GNAT family N-acetyltransferase [Cohaesibacter gelatinilyticus]SNZ20510.1 Acetyltransferase (GNAT) domain-containing protein [Cohaesibacter gelatinilyticus]
MSSLSNSVKVYEVSPTDLPRIEADLVKITADCVEAGASIGFLKKEGPEPIIMWWEHLIAQLDGQICRLFVAESAGKIAGCVLLARASKSNSRHRAEVQKLQVSPSCRRQGIAAKLLEHMEQAARVAGIQLLILDTESSSGAVPLYEACDYQMLGDIPNYAERPDGVRHPTRIFYKELCPKTERI